MVLLETQDLEGSTFRPVSKLLYSYSGRTLCIGQSPGTFVWDRTWSRYALLTGVPRVFGDFDAFLMGLIGVATLLTML